MFGRGTFLTGAATGFACAIAAVLVWRVPLLPISTTPQSPEARLVVALGVLGIARRLIQRPSGSGLDPSTVYVFLAAGPIAYRGVAQLSRSMAIGEACIEMGRSIYSQLPALSLCGALGLLLGVVQLRIPRPDQPSCDSR